MNEMHHMRDPESTKRLKDMLTVSEAAHKGGIMVEVGSFAGETMDLFTPLFERVYAVDVWDERSVFGISSPEIPQDVERRFDVAVAGKANVVKIKGESVQTAEGMPDGYFDFVYIDADHRYEGCLADIKAWLPKVKPGGIIAGHDYHLDFAGVIKAVQEVFAGRQNVIEYNWWVRV